MDDLTELADWIPCSVRMSVAKAIADPGSIMERIRTDAALEALHHWQARAAIEVVMREVARSPAFATAINNRKGK